MPNIGWPELIIILIVALVIFGPKRLAGLGSALGRTIREFRKEVRDIEHGEDAGDEPRPKASA